MDRHPLATILVAVPIQPLLLGKPGPHCLRRLQTPDRNQDMLLILEYQWLQWTENAAVKDRLDLLNEGCFGRCACSHRLLCHTRTKPVDFGYHFFFSPPNVACRVDLARLVVQFVFLVCVVGAAKTIFSENAAEQNPDR